MNDNETTLPADTLPKPEASAELPVAADELITRAGTRLAEEDEATAARPRSLFLVTPSSMYAALYAIAEGAGFEPLRTMRSYEPQAVFPSFLAQAELDSESLYQALEQKVPGFSVSPKEWAVLFDSLATGTPSKAATYPKKGAVGINPDELFAIGQIFRERCPDLALPDFTARPDLKPRKRNNSLRYDIANRKHGDDLHITVTTKTSDQPVLSVIITGCMHKPEGMEDSPEAQPQQQRHEVTLIMGDQPPQVIGTMELHKHPASFVPLLRDQLRKKIDVIMADPEETRAASLLGLIQECGTRQRTQRPAGSIRE